MSKLYDHIYAINCKSNRDNIGAMSIFTGVLVDGIALVVVGLVLSLGVVVVLIVDGVCFFFGLFSTTILITSLLGSGHSSSL